MRGRLAFAETAHHVDVAMVRVLAPLFLVLLLVPPAVFAAPELLSSVFWHVGETVPNYNNLASHYVSGSTYAEYGPVSPAGDTFGTAEARATADFGLLTGRAFVERTTGTTANTYWGIQSATAFFDTLLIDAPALTGTAGTTAFTFAVTGSSTLVGGNTSYYPQYFNDAAYYLDVISKTGTSDFVDYLFAKGTGPGTWVTDPIPFIYGAPFDIRVYFNVDARIDSAGSAVADYSHSARLSAIDVYDSVGESVRGFSLTTASGATYPIPEPTTLALLGLSLAGLGAMRRKKLAA